MAKAIFEATIGKDTKWRNLLPVMSDLRKLGRENSREIRVGSDGGQLQTWELVTGVYSVD